MRNLKKLTAGLLSAAILGSNSWSYTRLGRLDGDLSSLRADLGSGDVEITYSLAQ